MPDRKIGLFGGTFNPIHSGHLKAAEIVRETFILDEILFIPSFIPPHKSVLNVAPPADRFRMVELAVGSHPGFIASPVEIETPGPSYSVVTLEKTKAAYPKAGLFFILGIDAFLEIKTWKSYRQVLARCRFIVMSRPGYRLDDARSVLREEIGAETIKAAGPGIIPEEESAKARVFLIPIEALDISSTEIRNRIRRGESVGGLVPPAVAEYIRDRHLYQE